MLVSNMQGSCLFLLKLGPAVVIPFGFPMSPERCGQAYTSYFKNIMVDLERVTKLSLLIAEKLCSQYPTHVINPFSSQQAGYVREHFKLNLIPKCFPFIKI